MLELFINVFVTLFVVMDPLGTAAVFVGMTARDDRSVIRHLSVKASLVAFLILLFFGLCGTKLFVLLGISISSFRIAGGLLLFVVAARMLFGHNEPREVENDQGIYQDRTDIAVFPLAIPLLAGPGCITATILLFGRASSAAEMGVVLVGLVLVSLTALGCLLSAEAIQRLIGKSGTNVLARVMGILLAALSIQFVMDGIVPFLLKTAP